MTPTNATEGFNNVILFPYPVLASVGVLREVSPIKEVFAGRATIRARRAPDPVRIVVWRALRLIYESPIWRSACSSVQKAISKVSIVAYVVAPLVTPSSSQLRMLHHNNYSAPISLYFVQQILNLIHSLFWDLRWPTSVHFRLPANVGNVFWGEISSQVFSNNTPFMFTWYKIQLNEAILKSSKFFFKNIFFYPWKEVLEKCS